MQESDARSVAKLTNDFEEQFAAERREHASTMERFESLERLCRDADDSARKVEAGQAKLKNEMTASATLASEALEGHVSHLAQDSAQKHQLMNGQYASLQDAFRQLERRYLEVETHMEVEA